MTSTSCKRLKRPCICFLRAYIHISWPDFAFNFNETLNLRFKLSMLQLAIATAVGWIMCVVLTETGLLPTEPGQRGYNARTDVKTAFIAQRDWIFIPQPGSPLQTFQYIITTCASVMLFLGLGRNTWRPWPCGSCPWPWVPSSCKYYCQPCRRSSIAESDRVSVHVKPAKTVDRTLM